MTSVVLFVDNILRRCIQVRIVQLYQILNNQSSRHLSHYSSRIMRVNNMGAIYFTTITHRNIYNYAIQAIYPYKI